MKMRAFVLIASAVLVFSSQPVLAEEAAPSGKPDLSRAISNRLYQVPGRFGPRPALFDSGQGC